MWGKKKQVEEPVTVDEVFDDLHAELDDIVVTAEQPEAEVPEDFEARVNELTELLREAQERAAKAKLAKANEGLSPFKTPFESKPAAVAERPRSLNRRITRVEVEAGESRIVSQFEDNEPEEKKAYPAVWNLGYRLEELAAAVAGILGDAGNHFHEEYAGKVHSHDMSHEHDFPSGVIVSDQEPQPEPGEEIEEGTLWYDTDRLEMFIFYDGGWITTTALGARVAEGEAKQRDIESRLTQAVTDISAIRTDLEDRVTVQLWKYKGSNHFNPANLDSGEFCIWIGSPNNTLKIYLSQFDATGNRWITNFGLNTTFDKSVGISIDQPGRGGQYNALLKSVHLNTKVDEKTVHLFHCENRYNYRDMSDNEKYVIQVPGFLPIYSPFNKVK